LLCKLQALIAIEKQKVAEKEAETQKKIALSEAEIRMEQKLMEKDSAKRQEAIENEMFVAREKAQTDANFYRYYHDRPRSLILVNIGFGTVEPILV